MRACLPTSSSGSGCFEAARVETFCEPENHTGPRGNKLSCVFPPWPYMQLVKRVLLVAASNARECHDGIAFRPQQ